MTHRVSFKGIAAAALLAAAFSSAHAGLIISEVSPYSSGNTPFGADWFELTNTGTSALVISGWKMDDNSNAFGSAVPMTGISSIAGGESVVFLECAANCAAISEFKTYWGAPVAAVQIGTYNGSGVGLSNASDAVNVFNASGALLTRVDFGTSTVGRTFDNAAGQNNVTLTTLSTVGVNGAFRSVGSLSGGASGQDVGSPGTVGVFAVPEADGYAMAMAGFVVLGAVSRRRRR